MKHLGSDLHVIAVCQPAPLTLAAVAYLAEEDPSAQPRSMTLIGGPIDPEANHTEVTDFGRSVTMGQLENTAINVSVAGYTRLVRMDVHVDIDIVIRDSTGAVRATLATEVANTAPVSRMRPSRRLRPPTPSASTQWWTTRII